MSVKNSHARTPGERPACLDEMDWNEITEPGCYLHVSSGLLARVFPEELGLGRGLPGAGRAIPMVRLSGDPETSLARLRAIAAEHQYPVGF